MYTSKKRTTENPDTLSNAIEQSSNRREFIRKSLMAASLLGISPHILFAGDPKASSACDPTATDFYGLGPYYAQNSPTRQILAKPDEPGTRMFLTGIIFANDCTTPLNNTKVEMWHADDTGCYSIFQNCENVADDEYKMRGQIITGADGMFAFESVIPGRYLNGTQFRPSHVHYKITHTTSNTQLVTQLYFEGDPYIPVDAAASRPDAAGRIIPLETNETGMHGVFDIVLDVAPDPTSDYNPVSPEITQLRQNYPNPFTGSTIIPLYLAKRERVTLTVFDSTGRLVRTLTQAVLNSGVHAFEWDGTDGLGKRLPSGAYSCRMETTNYVHTRTMVFL